MSRPTRVALVTGASSGIGADAALRLKEAGYTATAPHGALGGCPRLRTQV